MNDTNISPMCPSSEAGADEQSATTDSANQQETPLPSQALCLPLLHPLQPQPPPPSPSKQSSHSQSALGSLSTRASGKKNHVWSLQNVVRLVDIIYDSKAFQCALLPPFAGSSSGNPSFQRKESVYSQIFKEIWPSQPTQPGRIKSKLRWLVDTYRTERKNLSLTGAGVLDDLD